MSKTKIRSLSQVPAVASYLQRIGAEPRSLRTAVVKKVHGAYWTDIATIRFRPDGEIDAPGEYAPTDSEKSLIKAQIGEYDWPKAIKLGKTYKRPEALDGVPPDAIFEFRDTDGQLIMLQHRTELIEENDKRYQPWTFFDDEEWRSTEPDGPLPLWGLEHLKDHTTVFIHEGAKAARAMQRLLTGTDARTQEALANHPWGGQLKAAAHLGWIGGALSPHRTDWSILGKMGVKRAYIIADNDVPGKQAIPKIASRLKGITTFAIEFNELFPAAFDMADEWPERFFQENEEEGRSYNGPTFLSMLQPATWATDQIPQEKGRPLTVLREEFRSMWVWIEESDLYVCREMPQIMRQASIFNGMMSAFSHVQDTAALVRKSYQGRQTRLAYRPDMPARMINDGMTSAINLHTPTDIKPGKGSVKPWEEFLEYLFPVERERHEVKRWIATLVARPDVRMLYAMLLVSKQQGMGKSTLGERILAPLVGMHNTGFPSEREIVESSFNSWLAHKRLVVVGEIYTGQSWKAYNTLKSYVTDKKIDVNEKFQRPYTIDNWAHIVACSNSEKALRLEQSDRRWFLPTVGEEPWSREKFTAFHKWISCSGLGIIMRWAQEFGDYVMVGEHAPMTDAKMRLIEESMSDAQRSLMAWADGAEGEIFAITDKWVREYLEKEHHKVFESASELRKLLKGKGWDQYDQRIKVDGQLVYVMMSPAMKFGLANAELHSETEARDWVRSRLRRMVTEGQEGM